MYVDWSWIDAGVTVPGEPPLFCWMPCLEQTEIWPLEALDIPEGKRQVDSTVSVSGSVEAELPF